MGWFKNIFSGAENTNKIVDGFISGSDKLIFTDEEKSDANLRKISFALEWLKSTSGQNLARRYIAIIFVIYFLLVVSLLLILIIFDHPRAGIVSGVIDDFLFYPFSGIMGFYYMTHLIRGAKK